jgi:hypothetical protein
VFSYFEELASARQVMLRLLEPQRKLPRRSSSDRQLRWVPATYSAIHDILTDPELRARLRAWAQAHRAARGERRRATASCASAPREEWHVCIADHHAGYVSFERYPGNQERLRANWRPARAEGGGCALLGQSAAARTDPLWPQRYVFRPGDSEEAPKTP